MIYLDISTVSANAAKIGFASTASPKDGIMKLRKKKIN